MFEQNRIFNIEIVPNNNSDIELLAEKLTEHTWCLCQGFKIDTYLLLNDSISEDGAQEYSVCKILVDKRKNGNGVVKVKKVESITFGWCKQDEAEVYLDAILRGEYDEQVYNNYPSFEIQIETSGHMCIYCL